VDLGIVVTFCRKLRDLLHDPRLAGRPVCYYTGPGEEDRTNAAFLLAAFLVLVEGMAPDEAWAPLALIQPTPFKMFRDATHLKSDFDLSILDCLHGLARGREENFFSLDEMDVDDFRTMDELGVSRMCPKFVAFKGPYSGPEKPSWAQDPTTYMAALDATGVTDVVRLNEASSYDSCEFTEQGMAHHDLEFTDCSSPNLSIVTEFMRICNEAEGTVAVHCLAGLGRTGTLIGLWLMGQHQWNARETIGWLRLVRPGSVIGEQQHFLVTVEDAICGDLASSLTLDAPAPRDTCSSATAAQRAKEVTEGLARRTLLAHAGK
jgi:cell division cycle 14